MCQRPRCNPKTFGYWITLSARSSSDCGIPRPSAFAAFRLITSSNLARLLDGKIGWLGALEDLVNIDRGASIHVS